VCVTYVVNEVVPSILEVMTSKVAMATFGVGLVFRVDWVLAANKIREHNTTRRHFGSTTIKKVVQVKHALMSKLSCNSRVAAKNPRAAFVVKRRTRICQCCWYLCAQPAIAVPSMTY
jgi:hypothetical protein